MPRNKFLIDIERDVLRSFRTLARRALKLTPRSHKPQIELIPVPGGVILQAGKSGTIVRRILLDESIEEPVSVSFELLDKCQGRRGEVELRLDGDSVEANWQDGDIPRVTAFEVGTNDFHDDGLDIIVSCADSRLLHALAEASAVTDQESTRYALSCLQLSGGHGRVTGTDGRQLLSFSGLDFPWEDDILVPASDVFGSADLCKTECAYTGVSGDRFLLRCDYWMLELPIDRKGRFPRVEGVLPDPADAVCRVRLSDADRHFLQQNLGRLPGAERENSPVTVDLNGRVALLAADDRAQRVTEVTLAGSTNDGRDVRFATNRKFLQRAAKLGLEELHIFGPSRPVLGRGDNCSYVWMPLAADRATQPESIMIRISSGVGTRQMVQEQARQRSAHASPSPGVPVAC